MPNFSHVPPVGTILTRTEFQKLQPFSVSGRMDGCDWSANINYGCHDAYGPNQRVEILGITVTAWADPMRSSNRQISPGEEVEHVVQCLLLEAREECDHDGATEISGDEAAKAGVPHFGNCYHTYKCPKCGRIYGVDTSD